jgi:predicted acyltransferase
MHEPRLENEAEATTEAAEPSGATAPAVEASAAPAAGEAEPAALPLASAAEKPAEATPAAPTAPRLVSLDAYRGFTMLAMVSAGLGMGEVLQSPDWASWHWLADQFSHRQWEGCTFWDLIQPSFMFIVGVAMPFAFARRQQQGDTWGQQFRHVVERCLLLVLIGIFLDSYGKTYVVVQLIRVLQQIAIGYFITFLLLRLGPLLQLTAAVLILVGHTAAYLLYGGGEAGPWVRDHNFGAFLDQSLHAPFEWLGLPSLFPPSTGGYVTFNAISASATILLGVVCGEWLRRGGSAVGRVVRLASAGALCLAAGFLLTPEGHRFLHDWLAGRVDEAALSSTLAAVPEVPMIKRIWTSSFGLYAAGWTFFMLLGFYLVIDVLGLRAWSLPLVVVGMNSIAVYVAAGILRGTIVSGLKPFVSYSLGFVAAPWQPVIMAVLVTLVLWLLCYWLYRRRIFFKV